MEASIDVTLYGENIERVDSFVYLGRCFASDDGDELALQRTLIKPAEIGTRSGRS